ncbi:hypothetical protein WJX84_007295 [Apatococcus fuscideae]|uniref:Uncharacterized protein n=1 Tax=Apatococcus fuscideae TaxID=2026836 RepID=A0AAW1SM05_9CHLO
MRKLLKSSHTQGRARCRYAVRRLGGKWYAQPVGRFGMPSGSSITKLQTVAPSAATGVAKPLKTQPVDKNKVWLLFGAGAAGIFTTAVLLENNERLFPAIAKANQAMRAAQQYRESQPEDPPIETSMAEPEGPSQSAFEAGLKEASQKAKSQPAAADMLQSSALPEPESEPDRHTNRSDQMQPQSAELKPQEARSGLHKDGPKQLQPKG